MIKICYQCHTHFLSTDTGCPHCRTKIKRINGVSMLAILLGFGLTACGEKEDPDTNEPTTEPSDTAGSLDSAPEPNDAPLYGVEAIDQDQDSWPEDQDCDDLDANTFPGAAENESTTECMTDADNDGYGDKNAASPIVAGLDCNDSESTINPGVEEVLNDGLDNNCDGVVDESSSDLYGVPE
jgi:hypothetical protein